MSSFREAVSKLDGGPEENRKILRRGDINKSLNVGHTLYDIL
jgi:hypothetical protein